MVRRLFQNYYAQSVDPKYKNQLDLSLLYKNRLDFYCTKINQIFIAQKLTQFLLHKNQGGVYFTDRTMTYGLD